MIFWPHFAVQNAPGATRAEIILRSLFSNDRALNPASKEL